MDYRAYSYRSNVLPLSHVSIFSYISVSWLFSLLVKAFKNGLKDEDMFEMSPENSTKKNSARLHELWVEEVESKGIEKASLFNTIIRFLKTPLLIGMGSALISGICMFLSASYILQSILEYFEHMLPITSLWFGVVLVICLMISELVRCCTNTLTFNIGVESGMKLKVAVMGLLMQKLLRIRSLSEQSTGQYINIFTVDTNTLYETANFASFIVMPIVLGISTLVYSYYIIGPWALLGCLILFLFFPIQMLIGKIVIYLSIKNFYFSDKRINLTSDILKNIKLIKMTSWESFFIKSLSDLRKSELKYLGLRNFVFFIVFSLGNIVPIVAYSLTFIAFLVCNNNLQPHMAFTLVAVFHRNLYSLITVAHIARRVAESKVSCERIKKLLLSEEIQEDFHASYLPDICVKIDKASFNYNNSNKDVAVAENDVGKKESLAEDNAHVKLLEKPKTITTLSDISMDLEKSTLVGVCGSVGSGKSSLLLALLNQISLTSGSMNVNGSIAYVPQTAWIFNATLKENILFGKTFEEERYKYVLSAACLNLDLQEFPDGDLSEIGENGINLSGGQKQRVSLARALYSDSDIYLLDDPLSAVDSNVGHHIFKNAIKNALKEKIVILVSHQLQYLKDCNFILYMKDGQIVESGTHDQLMNSDSEYAFLIKKFIQEKNSQEDAVDNSVEFNKNPKEDNEPVTSLIVKESKQSGNLSSGIIFNYFCKNAGCCVSFLLLLSILLYQATCVFNSSWLGEMLLSKNESQENMAFLNGTDEESSDNFYNLEVFIFSMSVIGVLVFGIIRSFFLMKSAVNASKDLHLQMLKKVIYSPITFFDKNPSGRILNRFTKDLEEVDVQLPTSITSFVNIFFFCIGGAVQMCVIQPYAIIPLVICAIVSYLVEKFYQTAVNELKRLDSISQSPVINHLSSSLHGMITIQTYKKQRNILEKFLTIVDLNCVTSLSFYYSIRWFAFTLDFTMSILVAIAGISIVLSDLPGALAGVAFSASCLITSISQFLMHMKSETEAKFIAVERVQEYIQTLSPEGRRNSRLIIPPKNWPIEGEISFDNVQLKYQEELPLVLKNVSFIIQPKEKIGIVGRTGSGKSSLAVALYRLIELTQGSIKIDAIDISEIRLQDLRSRLCIIPQESQLFTGTVRYNLDPFSKYTDEDLWNALEKSHLKHRILSEGKHLETEVDNSGENFSAGERQLLCLARALLRKTKILILDEATASVDTETDSLIQETIKKEFSDCTVLTIAHRLNTVLNSDKILVMDAGEVVEYDTPVKLLSEESSKFTLMMKQANLL